VYYVAVKHIQLTQGKVAIIDDKDFKKVSQFKWCVYRSATKRFYAVRNVRLANGKQRTLYMARFITGLDFGDPREADHKDHEATLDNRRKNLRVTLGQNQQNCGLLSTNTSGVKGVHWNKELERWKATIGVKGKKIHLGYFLTRKAARAAYDAAAIEHHGEFAVTNQMLAA
jgi:hypothetical protein